jgi:hypothetical protein
VASEHKASRTPQPAKWDSTGAGVFWDLYGFDRDHLRINHEWTIIMVPHGAGFITNGLNGASLLQQGTIGKHMARISSSVTSFSVSSLFNNRFTDIQFQHNNRSKDVEKRILGFHSPKYEKESNAKQNSISQLEMNISK